MPAKRYFLLWLLAALLAIAAVVIQYVRSGELNLIGAFLGLVFVAMSIVSYSRSRAANAASSSDR